MPPAETARRPVTVCHRGASALAPENSLAAFELAMQHGVDYSELDVHLSLDGKLVVAHDEVPQLPAARLGVPRLEEVFDLVRGSMGIYVELKGDGTAGAFGAAVASGAARGVELIAGSARIELVQQLREAAPAVPSSILFTPGWTTPDMIAACRQLGTIYAHPCFRPTGGFLPTVEALHAAGLLVMTPHTNDPAEARHFAQLGVDVIASDDPRVLVGLAGS